MDFVFVRPSDCWKGCHWLQGLLHVLEEINAVLDCCKSQAIQCRHQPTSDIDYSVHCRAYSSHNFYILKAKSFGYSMASALA